MGVKRTNSFAVDKGGSGADDRTMKGHGEPEGVSQLCSTMFIARQVFTSEERVRSYSFKAS